MTSHNDLEYYWVKCELNTMPQTPHFGAFLSTTVFLIEAWWKLEIHNDNLLPVTSTLYTLFTLRLKFHSASLYDPRFSRYKVVEKIGKVPNDPRITLTT